MGQTAGNIFNPDVANPNQAKWGDLDGSEKTSRFLAGGLKGLGQGMQTLAQRPQSGGGAMPVPMPQQPNVQLPGMLPKGNNLAFYGGQ